MATLCRKDKLLLKLLSLLSGGKISVTEGKDDVLHCHFLGAEEAVSMHESLSAILGKESAGLKLHGNEVIIENGAEAFDIALLDLCVRLVERLVFLTGFTGWQDPGFENPKMNIRHSTVKLAFKRDKKVLQISMPASGAPEMEKSQGAYFYPSVEANAGGFELNVTEESIEKIGAMLLALVNPRQLSEVETSHIDQISSIYMNMRAVRALRHLLGLAPSLKYFSRFAVFRSNSRASYLPKTVYIIESKDPAATQLAHDFLKQKILLDSGEGAYEKDGKYWFEIEEDEVLSSLDTLELIPAQYEHFAAAVSELYKMKGISRMSLRNGQLRIRCDLTTFSELSRLAWANIPLGRLKSKAGRTYSNRIYFDPFDLNRQLPELMEISELLAASKAYSEESIAA